MSKRRATTTATVVGLVLALGACGSDGGSGGETTVSDAASGIKLGLITKFPADFYSAMEDAAKQWDADRRDATVLLGVGAAATDDAGQIALIESMVSKGVKGIAITPTSPAVQGALQDAVDAGVTVVLLDNDLPEWDGKTAVVSTDNRKGGVLAGRWLAENLEAGSTVGVLQGVPGVPALDDRVAGMREGLGDADVTIVGQEPTDCDEGMGTTAAASLLAAHPDLTAIYAACGPPALGAVGSLRSAGKKRGEVKLMGFDGLPDEFAAIQDGSETATVVQFPSKMGTKGLTLLLKAINGEPVRPVIDTGTKIVTKDDVADFL